MNLTTWAAVAAWIFWVVVLLLFIRGAHLAGKRMDDEMDKLLKDPHVNHKLQEHS